MWIYIFGGCVWLVMGGGMLLWPFFDPRGPRFTIFDTGISFGWLLLIFAGLNFSKAWLQWRVSREKAIEKDQPPASRQGSEYDPTFDFPL